MDYKNEFRKFSKSLIDSTNVIVNIIDVNNVANSIKNTQQKFSEKLSNLSNKISDKIKDYEKENDSSCESCKCTETNIETLDISDAIKNSLKNAGINTVEKLKEKNDEDLLQIKGIGKKTLESIKKALDKI